VILRRTRFVQFLRLRDSTFFSQNHVHVHSHVEWAKECQLCQIRQKRKDKEWKDRDIIQLFNLNPDLEFIKITRCDKIEFNLSMSGDLNVSVGMGIGYTTEQRESGSTYSLLFWTLFWIYYSKWQLILLYLCDKTGSEKVTRIHTPLFDHYHPSGTMENSIDKCHPVVWLIYSWSDHDHDAWSQITNRA
jgi:hypothetical protein